MSKPFFVASSAQVTLLHRLASSAFGSYKLEYPDGVDVGDVVEFSAPGNELGYVASLSGERVGGFARRFVRADVQVSVGDAASLVEPFSDVDSRLREVRDRVGSDVFVESSFGRGELGVWREYEDFDIGDLVDVEVFGRVVSLPVTRIGKSVSDFSDDDVEVHVGGQVVSDADARAVANADVHRVLMAEQREMAGLVSGMKSVQSDVESARSVADSAVADVAYLRGVLGGDGASETTLFSQLAAINAQIISQGGESQPGLLPMYISMNTRLWEQQQEINAQQDKINALQDQLINELQDSIAQSKEEMAELAGRRAETIIATSAGASHPDFWVEEKGDIWSLKGPFSSGNVSLVEWWARSPDSDTHVTPVLTRAVVGDDFSGVEIKPGEVVRVTFAGLPVEVKRFKHSLSEQIYVPSGWSTVPGFVFTADEDINSLDISAQMTWEPGMEWYEVRIVRSDGTVLTERRDQGHFSFSNPWGTIRPLNQSLRLSHGAVPAGQSVMLEVKPGTPPKLNSASWAGSWTQKK